MAAPLRILGAGTDFPPLEHALTEPNGLLAVGGDLTAERLLAAYRQGIFPWYEDPDGPVLWWSPDPRAVLRPDELHVSRSLRKRIRRGDYRLTLDTAFPRVVRACAAPRDGTGGTWITAKMSSAYTELHDRGFAHSVEAWYQDDLVGGLYGVSLGRMFFGESMFSRRDDASKVALAGLARQLDAWDFQLIDCQLMNPHLASLGAYEIPRRLFAEQLAANASLPSRVGRWYFNTDWSSHESSDHRTPP